MFDHTNDIFAALAADEMDAWAALAVELGHDPELMDGCLTPEDATLAMAEDMLRA